MDPWAELRKPAREVHYDEHGFPATLLDWRTEPKTTWSTVRRLWDPLESFFEEKGYTLFVTGEKYNCCLVPKDRAAVRQPDEYHEVLPEDGRRLPSFYLNYTNKLCPATRKRDGLQVMVQLVRKGDLGQSELEILRYFSQPGIVNLPDNHVIPLLDELHYKDMSFAIVPLLAAEGFGCPAFHTQEEVLEAMEQTFEGLAFIHSHHVAHRDLGVTDILHNFGGSTRGPQYRAAHLEDGPFRSLFRCRYYFVDFELAIKFEGDSAPESRLVRGLPCLLTHGSDDPAKYGKPLPPEWIDPKPYCPFASDVFQLGRLWLGMHDDVVPYSQPIKSLLEDMTVSNPSERPKMPQVVERLKLCRESQEKDDDLMPVAEARY